MIWSFSVLYWAANPQLANEKYKGGQTLVQSSDANLHRGNWCELKQDYLIKSNFDADDDDDDDDDSEKHYI